jgi:hypothetical protein
MLYPIASTVRNTDIPTMLSWSTGSWVELTDERRDFFVSYTGEDEAWAT